MKKLVLFAALVLVVAALYALPAQADSHIVTGSCVMNTDSSLREYANSDSANVGTVKVGDTSN